MCAGRLDQPGEHRPAAPLQRRLAGVGRPELEGGDAEPVPPLLRQVDHEALVGEHPQQVVDAGAGEPEVAGDGRGGLRLGVPGEQAQHGQGVRGCRCVGHAAQCLRYETVDAPRWWRRWSVAHGMGACFLARQHAGHGHRRHRSADRGRGRGRRPPRRAGRDRRRGACRHPDEPRAGRRAGDDDEPHYGISTGFGALANRHIPVELRQQLQASLVRSHSAGSGPEVEREVVRALMLLRLSTLATGRTGVREVTAQTYAAVLNAGITPVVHEYGSLGCSGDLAPLAHCALAAHGRGSGTRLRRRRSPLLPKRWQRPASSRVVLREKEGLALINGTDGMLGMLVLALHDLRMLLATADVTAAMSVEGLLGTDAVFAADLQALRPHPGSGGLGRDHARRAGRVADHGSSPRARLHAGAGRVLLRCAPQVTGAARDAVDYAALVASRELASAVDNPVITLDGRVESNGNFHGAPVAYALDFLAIVAADVASMAERRTDRFLDASRSQGLNPFLADDPGVDSGYMIAQYTQAAIVSELKRLAAPSSVDSIPSSAMQEDHVSMGWSGARKLRRVGRRADPGARHRAAHRRARHRAARAARSRRRRPVR